MSYAEPLYAAPITLAGTETISVTFSAGASSNYVCTLNDAALTAGTIYNDVVSAGSFAAAIVTELDAAEVAAGNTATWAASTPGTGLGFRLALTRVGDTGDVMATFDSSINITHFGYTSTTLVPGSEMVNSTPNTVITGTYQRGYLWLPRALLTRVTKRGEQLVAATRTNDASSAVVDGYGGFRTYEHQIDFVHGAAVYLFASADVEGLGYYSKIANMTQGDPNVPLETFWRALGANTGAAPVVRYYKDNGTLSSPESITFDDPDWFSSMDNVAEVLNEAPLFYRVTMRGTSSV